MVWIGWDGVEIDRNKTFGVEIDRNKKFACEKRRESGKKDDAWHEVTREQPLITKCYSFIHLLLNFSSSAPKTESKTKKG